MATSVRVQHPKEAFADVGMCERTRRHIRLCYNEFIGSPLASTPARPLPAGMLREGDATASPTAEDVATGAAVGAVPTILLVMGVASPGMFWDDRFCSTLAEAGPYRVIRFDNRDVGLSTHLQDDDGDAVASGADPDQLFAAQGARPTAAAAAPHARTNSPRSNSRDGDDAFASESVASSATTSVTSFFSSVFGRGRGQSSTPPPRSASDEASRGSANAPDYLRFAYAAMNPGKRVIPETYSVDDMAKDALGLMDALNVRTAHVVGMCLGGIIAQCMALRAPERICSLTLLATHTNDAHGVKWPSMLTMLSMIRCAPRASIYAKYQPLIEAAPSPAEKQRLEKERDTKRANMYAEALTKLLEMLAGDKEKIGFDRAATMRLMERAFQRSLYVLGSSRQVVATLNASPRGEALRHTITSQAGSPGTAKPRYIPTVILQGTRDTICPPENAHELAACIPGSRVVMLEGCGHVLAPAYRRLIVQSVQSVVQEGERARTAVGNVSTPPAVRSQL